MRFFGYYALHSFINQLRKLMKTWVLVFFAVCIVLGVVIGIGAAMLEDTIESNQEPAQVTEQAEQAEEPEDTPEWMTIDPEALLEAAAGLGLIALMAYEALSADKNGGKIFLPADVNLLFPSPMKPQSVLMFRLAAQLGTAVLATLWLMFQVPNMILNLGLSGWSAGAILIVWFFGILMGKLIQVLLYTLCSTNIRLKKYLSPAVYGCLLAVAGGFILSYQTSGVSIAEAADRFLNASWTRWIPFWGWLKGMAGCVARQEMGYAGMFLGLTVIGSGVLMWWIWQIKADFYEDAMAKSEETAAMMEKARSERTSGTAAVKQRKKDRSDTLLRDGLNRGQGASVYFHKTLYNRRRFAIGGFATKTMLTYLACAVGVGALCRFVLHTDSPVFIPLALAGFVFFRSMGDPLQEDTGLDFFRMIPEPAWKKLMWSLLGGSVCSLADLILPMLAGIAVQGTNALQVLVWLPVILSVGFYASATVSFIGLSVPASTGKTIKTLITVMFIYFGLLPDIGILAFGMAEGHTLSAALGTAAVNIFLGVLFFFLGSVYLDPRGREWRASAENVDLKLAGKRFSRVGWAVFAAFVLTTLIQMGLGWLLRIAAPEFLQSELALWLLTSGPQYLIAFPAAVLILFRVPAERPEAKPLGLKRGLCFGAVCLFLMYAGNLTGMLVNTLAGMLTKHTAVNPLEGYIFTNTGLRVLFVVILAPVMEEYLFRRQLIDRMRPYGGKTAVLLSGMLFGLFHGNLSQFFYAAALGIAFGYIYLNTGKLRYTIAAHIFINFIGMVLAPGLMEHLPEDMSAGGMWVWLYYGYVGLILTTAIVGLVVLIVNRDRLSWPVGRSELPRGCRLRTAYLNPGMLSFTASAIAMIIYYLMIQ